jgi:hypothetical protein
MTNHRRISLATVTLAVALTGGAVEGATASTPEIVTATEESKVRSFLEGQGITGETEDLLVRKSKGGVAWDSVIGAKPVSTSSSVNSGYSVTTVTYADGSKNVTGVELPISADESLATQTHTPGRTSAGTISNCSRSGTNTYIYTGCRVYGNVGTLNMSFTASYQVPNTAMAGPYQATKITSATNQASTVVAGNYSQEYFGIRIGSATPSTAANARYQVNYSGIFGAQTVRLDLNLPQYGPAKATITNG